MNNILHILGWDLFFENNIPKNNQFLPGRIVRKHNLGYDLVTESGTYFARLRGKLRETLPRDAWPAVGDWVLCSMQSDYVMIESLLPRKSKISRKVSGKTSEEQVIAANADVIFLVVSLYEDFNPRKIERYLVLAAESGATPVIILNKVDLIEKAELFLEETNKLVQDIPILVTNALEPDTLKPLDEYISEGKTIVFLGSSGAGKSTIVNVLLGEERQAVGGLGKSKKGKHTTTSRDMFFIKSGGILIDNPGIRELRVWLDSDEIVNESFSDIDELAFHCRFRNCKHEQEPDCAVLDAVAKGSLDTARLDNWRKLREEAFELLIKRQEFGRAIEKKQSSRIANYIKHRKNKQTRHGLR